MKKINGVWYVTYAGGLSVGAVDCALLLLTPLVKFSPVLLNILMIVVTSLAILFAFIMLIVLDPVCTLDDSIIGEYEERKIREAESARIYNDRR